MVRKANLKDLASSKKKISMSREDLLGIFSSIAEAYPFDEDFYLEAYPDVKNAIEAGAAPSARDHYINSGFIEGRVGSPELFNAEVYRQNNPDVASAFEPGDDEALLQHYVHLGCREGRVAL
ncbi:MAG: hypothetical protein AAFX86_15850 [Pseudomonadota bacterium]